MRRVWLGATTTTESGAPNAAQTTLRAELRRQEDSNRQLARELVRLQAALGASDIRITQLKQALLKLEASA